MDADAASTLKLYVDAIIVGRFQKDSDVDKVIEFVVVVFHHRGLVLTELASHVGVSDSARLTRLVDLLQALVRFSRPVGVNGRDSDRPHTRFAVVNQLVGMLAANPTIDAAAAVTIMNALTSLASDQVRLPDRLAWIAWWKALSARPGIGAEMALSTDAILTALLEKERAESEKLRERLLQESLAVLDHMETMKLPPLEHIVSSHDAVRARAIAVVKAVLPETTAEWQLKTLERVLALLSDPVGGPISRHETIALAGALGAVVGDADRSRLSKVVLKVSVDGQPELAESLLKCIVGMGILTDVAPVTAVYELARAGGEGWLSVKQLAMKAAQLNGSGLPLVIHALDDPVAGIRGDAALAIEALQDASVPEGVTLPVVALAHHALVEVDAAARGRMLESLDVLIRSKPARLNTDVLTSVIALVKHSDPAPRMAALRILTVVAADSTLTPSLQDIVATGLGESLLVSDQESEWKKIVDALLVSKASTASAILENWFDGQASTPGPTWRRLAGHFRQAWNKNPGRLWGTAVSLAALDRDGAFTDALPFGRRAIELIGAVPNHPMSRRLPEFGDSVARWQIGTGDAKACGAALVYLDVRLKETPNDGRILLLRAEALEILGRPDDAANDIALALSKGDPTLGDLPRPPLFRRLARHRFMAGQWEECRVAIGALIQLKSNQPGDSLMAAWSDILQTGGDRRRALATAAPLAQGQMADAAALLQATAGLTSADATLRGEALTYIAAVKEQTSPLYVMLKSMIQHAENLDALLQATPLDLAAAKPLMAAAPHLSCAIAVARLRADGRVSILNLLKELHPDDEVLQKIVWPAAGGGDTESVGWALVKWADARALPKKLINACLKGAAPHI